MEKKEDFANEEEVDPLGEIPEVVIRTTLVKYLSEPKDFASLMEASPLFCKVMKSLSSSENWLYNDVFSQSSFKDHFKSDKEIQKFTREICEDWRIVADNYFNLVYTVERNYSTFKFLQKGSTSPFFGTSNMQKIWLFDQRWYDESLFFRTASEVDAFLKKWGAGLIPFIRKSISFNLVETGSGMEPESGLKLLARFGEEIRSIDIMNLFYQSADSHNLNMLRQYLETLPNLAILLLGGIVGWSPAALLPVELPPLPSLNSLIMTDLHIMHSTALLPVVETLSVYFNQLTNLEVPSAFLPLYNPERHSTFPKLRRLSVIASTGNDLLKLRAMTSPLREIKIRCLVGTTLSVYFYSLERFRETLCAAGIHQMHFFEKIPITFKDLDCEEPKKFHFPNLRILAINLLKEWISLDCLLSLSESLGYLQIKTYLGQKFDPGPSSSPRRMRRGGGAGGGGGGGDDGEFANVREGPEPGATDKLQIRQHLEKMYESNIWSCLKALREVRITENFGGTSRLYKREEYEQLMEQVGQ